METVQKAPGKSVFSDWRVKLSCAFMGLGQLFCRQFTKGALLMALYARHDGGRTYHGH